MHDVLAVMFSDFANTSLLGQIKTGLLQTFKTRESDFTLEQRASKDLLIIDCMCGTER